MIVYPEELMTKRIKELEAEVERLRVWIKFLINLNTPPKEP